MRNFDRKNRNSEMPATLTDATRSALWVLVDREERRTGSRGVALEIVAQTVGMSSSWIAKFLSKSNEAKEPRITLFLNAGPKSNRGGHEKLTRSVITIHRATRG